uniref:Uncharacterized protein n=1 Tax=Strigamia maritima TaxID=126957 RepID=T1JMB9_STRMM
MSIDRYFIRLPFSVTISKHLMDQVSANKTELVEKSKKPIRRHVLQRQTTRYGLTSDDSFIGNSFETYLDEFLHRSVLPALALLIILITFLEINPSPGTNNRVMGASLIVAALTIYTWAAVKRLIR